MTVTAVSFYEQWIKLMRSWGHVVVEVDGWRSRGAAASAYDPRGGFFEHHDASTDLAGNWGSLGIIVAGRGGAAPVPGPLANLQFARDGQVAIVAAGPGNHAGIGGPMGGIPANDANRKTTGAEVANNGLGEPYSDALTRALVDGEAAWAIVAGRTASYVRGHKEWTSRKSDPRIDMNDRRAAVAAVIATGGPTAAEEDDMADPALVQKIDEIHWMLEQIKPQADRLEDEDSQTDLLMWAITDPEQGLRTQVARLAATATGDPNAVAAALAPLLVGPIVTALSANTSLTKDDVETAIRTVLGSLKPAA